MPGDMLFGDIDGVSVVPALTATEVFTKALEKVRQEKTVRRESEQGGSAVAIFEKSGIF
jgi:regulator of RNase E activity RraA